MSKPAILSTVAEERWSRQIVSIGAGPFVYDNAGGAVSIAVPYPTVAGSVAANVITFIYIALKPGTANLGAVATPAGWTKVGDHIGGGYGATLGVNTGNNRIYVFERKGDNAIAGTVSVGLTPNGANGVAACYMNRIEKLSGTWQPVVTATAEATVDTNVGVFNPTAMTVSKGDCLIYGFGITDYFIGTTGLNAGPAADLVAFNPGLAGGTTTINGYRVNIVGTGRRVKRGGTLGQQVHTIPVGIINRGPLLIARYRVR